MTIEKMMGNYKTKDKKKYLNNPALKETNLIDSKGVPQIFNEIKGGITN